MMAKEELPECPVATAVALIGGKWKLLIIRNLRVRPWRFNELRRNLEGISQKVLTDSLRQMEDDGLVFRHDYGERPAHHGLARRLRRLLQDGRFVADRLLRGAESRYEYDSDSPAAAVDSVVIERKETAMASSAPQEGLPFPVCHRHVHADSNCSMRVVLLWLH